MKTPALNRKLLKKFVQAAGDRLKGEWVLLGGTLLPLISRDFRSTADIDFVGLGDPPQSQILELMRISESLGLPVETINQAAAFFLKRIPNFEKNLLLLHEGRSAKVYRPSLLLFIQLKIPRLSDSDLQDCLEYLRFERKSGGSVPTKIIQSLIRKELSKTDDEERTQRLRTLLQAFTLK